MPDWAWGVILALVGAIVGALSSGLVAWRLERKRLEWEAKEARQRLAGALGAELELLISGVEATTTVDDALATMTTLASLYPTMSVFRGNTDKIGLFTDSGLVREIVGSYHNLQHLIDRGQEMWEQGVHDNLHSPDASWARLPEDAAAYVPQLKEWLLRAKCLRQKLQREAG
jgi:hypothetical protein